MIDWNLYLHHTQASALRHGRCAAAALEGVFQEACAAALASGLPEVIHMPPGHLVCRRDPEFRTPLGLTDSVIWQGPATFIWFPHRAGPEPTRTRTADGWAVVAPEPKLVERN